MDREDYNNSGITPRDEFTEGNSAPFLGEDFFADMPQPPKVEGLPQPPRVPQADGLPQPPRVPQAGGLPQPPQVPARSGDITPREQFTEDNSAPFFSDSTAAPRVPDTAAQADYYADFMEGYSEQNSTGSVSGVTQDFDSIPHEHYDRYAEDYPEGIVSEEQGKTRLMDSVQPEEPQPEGDIPPNPVKRRRKKKKHGKKKKFHANHTRTFGQIFLGSLLSVVAIGVGAFLAVQLIVAMKDFTGMAKESKSYTIEVDDNMNIDEIVKELHDNGIIEMPDFFKLYLNIAKEQEGFLNGEFVVKSNMSYDRIVATLKTKKRYTETVTVMIPEGSTAAEIGQLLEKNYVCRAEDFEHFYKNKQDKFDFEEQFGDNENRFYAMEGYLFPDTYEFYVIDDLKTKPDFDTLEYAEQAAEKMYKNFENKITKQMNYRMQELGMTLDEVITLASLIQWEGTNEDNMGMISSVFHNRMNDRGTFPMLQSDTTYTYIDEVIKPTIPEDAGDLYDDIIAAYDTYQCEGLPAGPICSPGLDAIHAALYPTESNYFYFLASEDGSFYYATTLDEHEQNIYDAELRSAD